MHSPVCRTCGSSALVQVLSFGDTPLANALLRADELQQPERRYPLDTVFCPACALFQITETVPPETLFREYVYLSSCSDTAVASARALANRTIDARKLDTRSLVVEVASNDGYLLSHYVARGVPVVGVEPARNIAVIAEERGVRTVSEFFGADLAVLLRSQYGAADVIHANNVLAHVPDLNGVVQGIARLLKDDGIAIVEVPYLRELIDRVEFDTIYHEHLCYFSLTAIANLVARHDLTIVDVEPLPIHGGTLRVSLQRASTRVSPSRAVEQMLADEHGTGLDSPQYYRMFAARVETFRARLTSLLARLRAESGPIAGYGAAAKGTTLLHYCGIGTETLSFIADRNPIKQGLFSPGSHIPIVPTERLLTDMPAHTLLLVWNFADEVLRQQAEYRRRGGKFIVPSTTPEIV